jgi:hypothetical protein
MENLMGVASKYKSKSGIKIKKSHEGLFTAKAKKAGMSVQAFAKHVLANKGNFDTSTIKQAVFCSNAKKWN